MSKNAKQRISMTYLQPAIRMSEHLNGTATAGNGFADSVAPLVAEGGGELARMLLTRLSDTTLVVHPQLRRRRGRRRGYTATSVTGTARAAGGSASMAGTRK